MPSAPSVLSYAATCPTQHCLIPPRSPAGRCQTDSPPGLSKIGLRYLQQDRVRRKRRKVVELKSWCRTALGYVDLRSPPRHIAVMRASHGWHVRNAVAAAPLARARWWIRSTEHDHLSRLEISIGQTLPIPPTSDISGDAEHVPAPGKTKGGHPSVR